MRKAAMGGLTVVTVLAGLALGGCDGDDEGAATAATTQVAPPADDAGGSGPVDGAVTSDEGSDAGTAGQDEGADDDEAADAGSDADADLDAETDDAAPTVVADVAPSVAPDELDEGADVPELVEPALEVQVEVLTEPETASEDLLVTVADGSALGAIRAQVLEYDTNGWSQVGAPRVVSAEVVEVDADADPPRAEVLVCLDHGDVDVVDADGVSLVDEAAPTRVLQLWRLEEQDGRWVLVEQTFTDETRC